MNGQPPHAQASAYDDISRLGDSFQVPQPAALPTQPSPPGYNERPPSYTAIDLQRYHDILDERSSDPATERLRRLITFSLTADYELTPIEPLPSSDWTH